ncbi:MAG: hypothetical protein HYZ28_24270 [Myxococcales bacterium]|nr:hypothetical protein [Myxococcales bacterium]
MGSVRVLAWVAAASVVWASCGREAGPTVSVSRPSSGATVQVEPSGERELAVTFEVTNFTLKPPGECLGAQECGHVHIFVDGGACGEVIALSSPARVRLDRCPDPRGDRRIDIELHDDQHRVVLNDRGQPIAVTVLVVVKVDFPDGQPPPAVCPQGAGARQVEWECRPGDDARVKVNAEVEEGELRVRVRLEELPAKTEVTVRVDVEGDGTPEAVVQATGGPGEIRIERTFSTCARNLSAAVATANICNLMRVEVELED